MKSVRDIRRSVSLEELLKVLTNNWQTTRLISSQLVFPPDAIARSVANHREGVWQRNKNMSTGTARAHAAARALSNAVKKGYVEKRQVTGNKNEYRLAQPKATQ